MSELQQKQPDEKTPQDLEDLPPEEVSVQESEEVKGGIGIGKGLKPLIKIVAPAVS